MQKNSMNPYLNARLFAGMTRPKAAMLLIVSERSLAEYELDGRVVPDWLVLKMTEMYRTPWLRVQHLQRNPVFCDIFGLVPQMTDKAVNVLSVQKEVSDVVKMFPELIEKTLSKSELGSRLIKECREATQALLALIGSESERRDTDVRKTLC